MPNIGVWSGIPGPFPGQPCDIDNCKSNVDVDSTMVEVSQSACVRSVFSHKQSNLCKACKEKGWIIFGKADIGSGITYYNLHTQEFKYSK